MDVPAAVDWIAHFMARAVTDDILPPAFLARLSTGASLSRFLFCGWCTPMTFAVYRRSSGIRRWVEHDAGGLLCSLLTLAESVVKGSEGVHAFTDCLR